MGKVRVAVTLWPGSGPRDSVAALRSRGMDIIRVYAASSVIVVGDIDRSAIDRIRSAPGVARVDNEGNFVTQCDHPSATILPDGTCTCLVCARCGQHTGNSNQGHYWSFCQVTRADRSFHFCCPGDCELET